VERLKQALALKVMMEATQFFSALLLLAVAVVVVELEILQVVEVVAQVVVEPTINLEALVELVIRQARLHLKETMAELLQFQQVRVEVAPEQ
jgi:hypothetical protein